MARKRQSIGMVGSWQGGGEEYFLRGLVERVAQYVLEAEMTSIPGAGCYGHNEEWRGCPPASVEFLRTVVIDSSGARST